MSHDTRDSLAAIRCPVLWCGEREAQWAHDAHAELARLLPHAERRVGARVAHLHPLFLARMAGDDRLDWLRIQPPA